MQVLEQQVPQELREASNAIERMRVAINDASEGTEAVENLDAAAGKYTTAELISSPQSEWFKGGQPNETDGAFSEAKKAELLEEMKKAYPDVPME